MHFLTPSECSEWDALRPRLGAFTDPTGYSRALLSHDEFVEFAADQGNEELVNEFLSLAKHA
jgi:hypothetical protein